ncbi:MAG: UDP-3-O-(3-hydroxymyristoyl)glucosamine N-acyltransferase [Candidatus Omnitrophica bacterium]|nr:UDP-3-O-(3-hydroxymyristoyl)glucosamine N-acyltransferase [Candidatus Omnitrophota bacterium]
MSYTVADIAREVGGQVVGDPALLLQTVNSLELARPDELSFATSPKHFKDALGSNAGCVIAPRGFACPAKTVILHDQPKVAFVKAMWLFHPDRVSAAGIHPSAVVEASATVGREVSIGPHAVIGKDARIGDRARLGSGVVVGERVQIGEGSVIHPNVTLYHDIMIGSRVVIHGGTVIGADGFGFVFEGGRQLKVPQLGNVVIEDDVEIGANCTIDRATFGSTVIKRGAKTDNLVHIAHNVIVGEHSLLVAQVGIAGSSKIGSHVTLAGQVGVADNATIGDYATVAGQSGVVSGQRIESHQTVWGLPARPLEETKRQLASLALLPKLLERLHKLEERLEALEDALRHSKVGP